MMVEHIFAAIGIAVTVVVVLFVVTVGTRAILDDMERRRDGKSTLVG